MRYLSVCSGIEAASCAWHPLGWEPVAFSEIEKFPSAVLAHHYPTVPNWGDMTKFKEWPDADVDVLVGGTPCQSFSVAGLRKGLADPRGNLALTYLALADKYRPEWLVWENVPGVLSADGGEAFGAFLGGLGELGYGWAYRVLDAQYFGLAQRRKRVFVVASLGGWQRAAAVLFDAASLRGDSAPRREAGQGATPILAKSLRGCSGGIDREDMHTLIPAIANPLTARMHKGINTTCDEGQTMIAHSLRADGFDASEDGTGRGTPLVPIAFDWKMGEKARSVACSEDQSPTLGAQADRYAVAFDALQSDVIQYGDKTGPLDTDGHTMGILQSLGLQGFVDTMVAYANATEADADKVLSLLREVADSPEGARRRLGELTPFWTEEILRPSLFREGAGREAERLDGLGNDPSPREEVSPGGEVRNLQGEEGRRRSSSRRGSHQQRQGQSPAGVPQLSHADSSGADCVLNLRSTSEGSRLLQQALDSLEEVRRPADGARQNRMQVRRLTPVECSRLQGFPDAYLDITYRGKDAADGPRYKALGNSMAVPVMAWIGRRLQCVSDMERLSA